MALIQYRRATLVSFLALALALGGCATEVVSGTSSLTSSSGSAGVGGGPSIGSGPVVGVGTGGGGVPACNRSGADPGTGDAFARLKYGFAATWSGTATAPVGWIPDQWPLDAVFEANGHYSAQCLGAGEVCSAFYNGGDGDKPGKTYVINDLQSSGEGLGELQIYFPESDAWNTDTLTHIAVSDDLTSLKLQLWHGIYGPVFYDLHCTN
jgi:hypothetical protein